jgi:uncharacterized protein (TIGR00725 family)
MNYTIAVCGSGDSDNEIYEKSLEIAEKIGENIAKRNAALITGGHGGIMRAACQGAKKYNGITIGILPGADSDANDFVDVVIPTNLGYLRNALIIQSADCVIAISGRWGTLSEISFAMILGKPIVFLKNSGGFVDKIIDHDFLDYATSSYYFTEDADDAVDKAFEFAELCK